MINIRVTPSELETFNDCQLKHHYRYVKRLELKEPSISPNMVSGRVVHKMVEEAMQLPVGHRYEYLVDTERIVPLLREEFGGKEENVKKYLPGVKRALEKVPGWMLDEVEEWFSEVDVSAGFDHGDTNIVLVGRPDLYRIDNNELCPFVEIIDVKTTENDAVDYILWNPQIRLYALVLSEMYPNHIICYRYLCLPTSGKGATMGSQHTFTPYAMGRAKDYMFNNAVDIRTLKTYGAKGVAREGMHCRFCDFNLICRTRVMGGDEEGVAGDLYQERERRS